MEEAGKALPPPLPFLAHFFVCVLQHFLIPPFLPPLPPSAEETPLLILGPAGRGCVIDLFLIPPLPSLPPSLSRRNANSSPGHCLPWLCL